MYHYLELELYTYNRHFLELFKYSNNYSQIWTNQKTKLNCVDSMSERENILDREKSSAIRRRVVYPETAIIQTKSRMKFEIAFLFLFCNFESQKSKYNKNMNVVSKFDGDNLRQFCKLLPTVLK